MTLPTELNAATRDLWDSDVEDIVFQADPLLYILFRKDGKFNVKAFKNSIVDPSEMINGGLEVRIPLEFQLPNGGALKTETVKNLAQTVNLTYAHCGWGALYAGQTVTFTEQQQNIGEAQMVDLVAKKLAGMRKKIQDLLATSLYQYNGVAGYGIYGLPDLFDAEDHGGAGTADYLGISRVVGGVNTGWGSQTAQHNYSATAYTMGFDTLQALFRGAKVGATMDQVPNLVLTSQTLKDSYEEGLQSQQRIGDVDMATAGWDNVYFRQRVPVVAAPKLDVTTNNIMNIVELTATGYGPTSLIGLNTKHLKLRTHPKYNFKLNPWASDPETNQNIKGSIDWSGMLTCSHRSAQVWFSNVSAA